MKDPKRWRNSLGGADAETRALLQEPPIVRPTRAEADRIWSSLSAHIDATFVVPGPSDAQPSLPGPAHAPQVAAAAAGAAALSGKVTATVVLLATVGSVVGGAAIYTRVQRDRAPLSVPTVVVPGPGPVPAGPAPAPGPAIASPPALPVMVEERAGSRPRVERALRSRTAASEPGLVDKAAPPPPVPSVPLAPPVPAAATGPGPAAAAPPASESIPVNLLLEEGRRLDQARLALRAQDPERALQLLTASGGGTSMLAQEREALTIEALAARPATRAEAAARARAFLRDYASSPYRARVKTMMQASE